jgi:hypothetical protein
LRRIQPDARPDESGFLSAFDSNRDLICAAAYLRDEAARYRQLAEQTDDPVIKKEMLELASVCEEVANNIEDHLTGG